MLLCNPAQKKEGAFWRFFWPPDNNGPFLSLFAIALHKTGKISGFELQSQQIHAFRVSV